VLVCANDFYRQGCRTKVIYNSSVEVELCTNKMPGVMRFWSKILGVAALAGVVNSCGTYRNIYSDFDKSIDFSKYETFAWAPDSGTALPQKEFEQTPYDNDIVRNNAKNYITHSLSHRGYLVNIDSPDVIIQLVLLNE